MTRRAAMVTGLAGAASTVGWAGDAPTTERSRIHEVLIQGFQYVPETLKVKRGDAVVWVNKDPLPHTVTSTGVFDSKSINAGRSWRFTARRAGSFAYVCTLHSNMKGTLQIE